MAFIETLRETYEAAFLICAGGFVLGALYGWVAEASRFCLRASIAEWVAPRLQSGAGFHRTARTRSGSSADTARIVPGQTLQFLVAILAAIVMTQALQLAGWIDLTQTIPHTTPLRIVAFIVGGFLFGIGTVLAGGCVGRLLVLAASGNLRSAFTLVALAVASYATLRGILSYPRLALEDAAPGTGMANTVPELLSISPLLASGLLATPLLLVVAALLRRFTLREALGNGAAGIAIGLLVALGWVITGVVGFDEFEPTPLLSLSFTAPLGDSLQYLMIFTGDTLRFGIALVGGVLVGAFLSALISGRFAVQGFQSERAPLRYALGGLLMGFGGITALGCSIGQGVTGVSTLAAGSILALLAIVAGSIATMIVLQRRAGLPKTADQATAPLPASTSVHA